jgi:hypothetical protein
MQMASFLKQTQCNQNIEKMLYLIQGLDMEKKGLMKTNMGS